jgi:adenylate cyclase
MITHGSQWDLWNQPANAEREMALLFLDIRNFTPLTGSFQAMDVVHLVKKLLTVFQRIVRNHRGRIIEVTGDGFYATFGFDQEIGQAVKSAINAGQAITKHLQSMNDASFERTFNRKIEAGIGIHAGKVATGHIHLNGEDHLMVMGHAVNIASRLQDATKELDNNVVISASAFSLLDIPVNSVPARVTLKGVADAFEVRMIGDRYAA